MLTPLQLQHIAKRSQSLQERLTSAVCPEQDYIEEHKVRTCIRLARWCELTSDGDQELFERRIANSGFNYGQLNVVLVDDKSENVTLPAWLSLLNEILEFINGSALKSKAVNRITSSFLETEQPVPFEEIFVPIIHFARSKVTEEFRHENSLMLDSANSDLDRFLLTRLSETCGRVLEVEFNSYLALLQLQDLDYKAIQNDVDSREYYHQFIDYLFQEGLEAIFCEYPVLARHLTHRVDQWIEIAVEFTRRLSDDFDDLRTRLGMLDSSRVVHLKPGLSDSHDNGRNVMLIEFETGDKVVYKPKELGLDFGYFQLVQWLNENGAPFEFKILQEIEKSGYGWKEFAEQGSITTLDGASRFYLRSGALLALFYALDGVDFHHENVVACGEFPTPIDCETIVQHQPRVLSRQKDLTSAALESINRSVLKSSFLPRFSKIRGHYVDVSGMGAGSRPTPIKIFKYSNINSDAMRYTAEQVNKSFDSANAPKLGDTVLVPENYVDDIVRGFMDTYRFLYTRKDQLFDAGSPFSKMFTYSVRYFNRATQLYGSLLAKIGHPKFQKDGVDFGIELERLYRKFLWEDELSLLWPLIETESADLFGLDLPKFMAKADGKAIDLGNGSTVESWFDALPLGAAFNKVGAFCESDLSYQCELIRSSIAIRKRREIERKVGSFMEQSMSEAVPALDRRQALEAACDIADTIRSRALVSKNGDPSWVTILSSEDERWFYVGDMKYDLYQGNLGVGVFFAAMEVLKSGSGYGDFAYSSISLVRRWLKLAKPIDIDHFGIGGLSGLGSLIYGLTTMSSILDDRVLREEALRATELVSEKVIDGDVILDIFGGTAGMLCALLALFRVSRDPAILNKALRCGYHLVQRQNRVDQDSLALETDPNPLGCAGFSRGVAGIAYALLSLYRETGEQKFYTAAEKAMGFGSFKDEAQTDDCCIDGSDVGTANDVVRGSTQGWCNGALGIALSRIGTLDVLNNESVRTYIEASLSAAMMQAIPETDHLCCGAASVGEALLSAGQKYHCSMWKSAAPRFATLSMLRHREQDKFVPRSNRSELFNPTLFQGSSGFGYHCLRLFESVNLPNILLLE